MRDIKFRAWTNRGKKVENYCYLDQERNQFYAECENSYEGEIVCVEQFTGMKDKNGIEIYEGDEVSFYDDYYKGKGKEEIEENKQTTIVKNNYDKDYIYEIIGNIHIKEGESGIFQGE